MAVSVLTFSSSDSNESAIPFPCAKSSTDCANCDRREEIKRDLRPLLAAETDSASSLSSALSGIESFKSSGDVRLEFVLLKVNALPGVTAEVETENDASVAKD